MDDEDTRSQIRYTVHTCALKQPNAWRTTNAGVSGLFTSTRFVGGNAGASTRRVGLGLQARAIELLATKHATMFRIADSQTAVKRVGFYMHNVKNRYLLKKVKIEEYRLLSLSTDNNLYI